MLHFASVQFGLIFAHEPTDPGRLKSDVSKNNAYPKAANLILAAFCGFFSGLHHVSIDSLWKIMSWIVRVMVSVGLCDMTKISYPDIRHLLSR